MKRKRKFVFIQMRSLDRPTVIYDNMGQNSHILYFVFFAIENVRILVSSE